MEKHSYRAGLWDAKTFTNHYWAESYRRGVEKARIVCINDGAILDDGLRFFPPHRNPRLTCCSSWQIGRRWPASSEASAWVDQKAALARGQLHLFFRRILRLYPNPADAPPEVKRRLMEKPPTMSYAAYRKAGFPISSGTVESAAKTLIQQRMKQAGMRWSRDGAQAMLALRARLLSDRWHEIPI